MNCDPLYHDLDSRWNVLSAPPSWLTGHILRQDCILAPIPAADYAKHKSELMLIPDIGIGSAGTVGSVLLFGEMPIEAMKTIALPTDSATSVSLLKYLLKERDLDVSYTTQGPDYELMMESSDGALLIGDRALEAAKNHPENIRLDLGEAWMERTGLPMVFGVFVARKDTPLDAVQSAHQTLLHGLKEFETSTQKRHDVIQWAMEKSDLSFERLDQYFGEVFNRLDPVHIEGLSVYLQHVFGINKPVEFAWDSSGYDVELEQIETVGS